MRGIRPRHVDGFLIVGPIVAAPLLWLFFRRNPRRRRPATQTRPDAVTAPPLATRLQQFLSNVEPVADPPQPSLTETVLPASTDGPPPRSGQAIGRLLHRIRGPESGQENTPEAAPGPASNTLRSN